MLVESDGGSGEVQALIDLLVASSISDEDISALGEGGHDGWDGAGVVGVDDTGFGAEVSCDVGFDLDMDILSSVEVWWAAWSHTVCAKSVDGGLLDLLVSAEVVVVVSCEVCHGLAGRELGLWARWSAMNMLVIANAKAQNLQLHGLQESHLPNNNRLLLQIQLLKLRQFARQRLRLPLIHQIINLIFRQRNIILAMRRVTRLKQISDEEQHQNKLDSRAHRVVLV